MDGGPFTNLWENNNRVLTSWLWKINTVLDHISPMKSQNLILGPHIMASSRFAISSGACSAMRSLHSWKLFVFNLQFLVVSTCLNPMLLLLNLQMSVGLLRILLVPKPDKIAGQAGRAQKKTELRIDWVHQLSHLWVVQMLGASLDHFGNTLPSSLKPKTWDGRNWWAIFSSG